MDFESLFTLLRIYNTYIYECVSEIVFFVFIIVNSKKTRQTFYVDYHNPYYSQLKCRFLYFGILLLFYKYLSNYSNKKCVKLKQTNLKSFKK